MGGVRSAARIGVALVGVTQTYVSLAAASRATPKTFDFALSLSVDVGAASMARFQRGIREFSLELAEINSDITLGGQTGGTLLAGASPRFRMYLPHSTFAELGVGYLRNTGTLHLDIDGLPSSFSYTNDSIEVPLLFGAYLAELDRVQLYGALGPSILVHNRSKWSFDRGKASDFAATRGGGIEFQLGGDLHIHRRWSVHLLVRYRYLRSSDLKLRGKRYPPVQDLGMLDYSGLSLSVGARWHSF